MGRWRSGAPLVLAPEKDDPALGADMQRNNDFNYGKMDPHGYAVPLGLAYPAHEPARHRAQHEPSPDDPARRHLWPGARRTMRPTTASSAASPRSSVCASLIRQFEFAQNVWVNDPKFQRTRQRTRSDHRHPGRHVRLHDSEAADPQEDHGLARVHHRQGRRLFLPAGYSRRCASLPRRQNRPSHVSETGRTWQRTARTHLQSSPRRAQIHAGQTAHQHLLDLELSLGSRIATSRDMDNRFSTMTEVRRVAWPDYETPEWRRRRSSSQGIAGTLELFHRSTLSFQKIAGEITGHPVAVFQRIDQAGYKLPIDERVLDDADTLMVFGLDHIVAEQEAAPEEIEAIREWLKREGTCLLLAPHHDVGFTGDLKQRQMEYAHHRDPLVPRQQRFGQYTRSLMKGLGVPGRKQLRSSAGAGQGHEEIAPLTPLPRPRRARPARRRAHAQFPSCICRITS